MRHGLIAARLAKGWSQQQVAQAIHKDRSSVTYYESGETDIPGSVALALANVFPDVPLRDLLINSHDTAMEATP